MASSSSSSSSHRTWRYSVFTSFHGPDIRKTFLSHLRKQFDDQGIERSHTIAPSLTRAINESRISIVVLSKNYSSSGWCLNELVEILKCKKDMGQIVMTIFYGVDPCDVRRQSGEFGISFKEICCRKTEEDTRRWSQALAHVGNIAGEHFLNWDNEAKIPYSIKALHGLTQLDLKRCRALEELRELPGSLTFRRAEDYQSLEILLRPFYIPKVMLSFNNCFTLEQRDIIPQSLFLHGSALLPGSEVPAVFDHRARGNSLMIRSTCDSPLSAFSRFKVCLVVSPNDQVKENRIPKLLSRTKAKGGLRLPIEDYVYAIPRFRTEHLFIFYSDFLQEDFREMVFEFSSIFHDFDVIECGAHCSDMDQTKHR